jgi:hypothetical protein
MREKRFATDLTPRGSKSVSECWQIPANFHNRQMVGPGAEQEATTPGAEKESVRQCVFSFAKTASCLATLYDRGRRIEIRIRHDLLGFGLLHSRRRALSATNLLRGGRQHSQVLRARRAPLPRPHAGLAAGPFPPRTGRPSAGTTDDGADRMGVETL